VVSLGPGANRKCITTYSRRSFEIQDISRVLDRTLRLLRDDGAVVCLNGTAVARLNMPGSTLDCSSVETTSGGESTFFPF